MPESTANLKRENNDVKSKVSTLTEEISRLKVEVSRLIKLFNTLGQPLFVIVMYMPCFMLV